MMCSAVLGKVYFFGASFKQGHRHTGDKYREVQSVRV